MEDFKSGESIWNEGSMVANIMQDTNRGVWCNCCKSNVKDPVLCVDALDEDSGQMNLCNPCIKKLMNDFRLKHEVLK
jgi:hypothetical protein